MTNNDILRRIRYALDLHDTTLIELCQLGGHVLKPSLVTALLKKEEDEGFLACSDLVMGAFLNGLIIQKRGPKKNEPDIEEVPLPITNNIILKKLRIALELQEDDLLDILELAECGITKPKLNALFRKEGHKNYRECGNQFLRSFLKGLALRHRNQSNCKSQQQTTRHTQQEDS